MENNKDFEMIQQIQNKLDFNLKDYNKNDSKSIAHEQDNIPNPFDKLSLEELLYIRKHHYFL